MLLAFSITKTSSDQFRVYLCEKLFLYFHKLSITSNLGSDYNKKFVTLRSLKLSISLQKRAYIWVNYSASDKNLGFHRTPGNTQCRSSLLSCRSIFESYMLIINNHLWVILIFHMNQSNKNKTDRINIHRINKLML